VASRFGISAKFPHLKDVILKMGTGVVPEMSSKASHLDAAVCPGKFH